jgi:hypothetical protein
MILEDSFLFKYRYLSVTFSELLVYREGKARFNGCC